MRRILWKRDITGYKTLRNYQNNILCSNGAPQDMQSWSESHIEILACWSPSGWIHLAPTLFMWIPLTKLLSWKGLLLCFGFLSFFDSVFAKWNWYTSFVSVFVCVCVCMCPAETLHLSLPVCVTLTHWLLSFGNNRDVPGFRESCLYKQLQLIRYLSIPSLAFFSSCSAVLDYLNLYWAKKCRCNHLDRPAARSLGAKLHRRVCFN